MGSATDLPEFERPPVIEVVCGVLFKSLEKLLAPHLGVFWNAIRKKYPLVQEVAPLAPAVEMFAKGDQISQTEITPEFTVVPPLPRIWFTSGSQREIIQVQRDRFLHNWRKVNPSDTYPRYPQVTQMFFDNLELFDKFLKEEEIGFLEPLQYELTYINHIPQGEHWNTFSEVGKVLTDFSWHSEQKMLLKSVEAMNWRTSFAMPNNCGRLHVNVQAAAKREDRSPLLLLELTARGIDLNKSRDAMKEWFDLAHEWIVKGFCDITDEGIQKDIWRRLK